MKRVVVVDGPVGSEESVLLQSDNPRLVALVTLWIEAHKYSEDAETFAQSLRRAIYETQSIMKV